VAPIDPERVTLFAFDTSADARIFVHKLAHALDHLAIYIEREHVIVLDGGDPPRRREIVRLARKSGIVRAVKGLGPP
jgi:hypothetical protein